MRRFAKVELIRHTNLTARLPEKCFLPARSMPANITLKEMCVQCMCFIIIKKIYMDIFPPQDEAHPFSHSNTLEARLASALETMSLRETGPELKLSSVGG